MNPILKDVYHLVMPAAPYVIAAYALLWAGLLGYVAVTLRRVGRLEAELHLLEDAIARKGAGV